MELAVLWRRGPGLVRQFSLLHEVRQRAFSAARRCVLSLPASQQREVRYLDIHEETNSTKLGSPHGEAGEPVARRTNVSVRACDALPLARMHRSPWRYPRGIPSDLYAVISLGSSSCIEPVTTSAIHRRYGRGQFPLLDRNQQFPGLAQGEFPDLDDSLARRIASVSTSAWWGECTDQIHVSAWLQPLPFEYRRGVLLTVQTISLFPADRASATA